MPFNHISQIILLIFDTISIVIYILFLLTIIVNRKHQPFQSEFFQLSISLGVADIATVIHSYLFVRAPSWGWNMNWYLENGSNGSFLPFYAISVQFALSFSQHLGVLLIGINRFSRIVFNQSTYDKLWSGKKLYYAVALHWFLAGIWWASMTSQNFYYWRCYNNASSLSEGHFVATVDFIDQSAQAFYYTLAFAFNFLINLISFFIYVIVFTLSVKYTLKRTSMRVTPIETSKSSEINNGHWRRLSSRIDYFDYMKELKLAFSGFLLFITMLVYSIVLVHIAITENFELMYLWWIASDVFSCINPFSLLIMSKKTRKCFFDLVLLRWK